MKWVSFVIKGTEVNVAFDENSIHIYNAFPIKDDLKMRGYRWDAGDKSWHTNPTDVETELEVLKNDLQQVSPVSISSRGGELAKFPGSCSVAELRNRIDYLIQAGLKGKIWVRGLVASQVNKYTWLSYFDLKDEDEALDIYFKMEVKTADLERINEKLRESGVAEFLDKDLPIFALVEVHLSLRNAVDIRLRLLDILPEYTQARIRNQREITLDRLKQEGVLENQKRLTLPRLIFNLGLVTSDQGTSIQDILAGLSPFEKKYQFYFIDTRMEGVNAVGSVIHAIDYLEHDPGLHLDAIIIARGGGSEQSLAVFNDYRLCRRVCDCGIPILTAIGHEKDLSAVEVCSHLTPTPATPSGLGKCLQDRFANLQQQLSETAQKLIAYFFSFHNQELEKIRSFIKNIPTQVRSFLKLKEDRYLALVRSLEQAVSFFVRDQQRRIENLLMQVLARDKSSYEVGRKSIQRMMASILSRTRVLHQRAQVQVEKTISRIDFQKRRKVNELLVREIHRLSLNLVQRSRKVILDKEKALQNLVDLVLASDPENILKKGFTLTLDMNDRVIKSLQEFNRAHHPRLRFHDGIVKIKKEEEI